VTSPTDTAGHPDVAEISDLTEGLLPPERSADLRRHLKGCPLCADVHASLEEIRGLLGTVPGPPRMPDDVARRIDAALAAEAVLNATARDDTTTHEGATTPVGAAAPDGVTATPVGTPTHTVSRETTRVSRETSPRTARPVGRAGRFSTGPGRKDGARRGRSGRRRLAALGAVVAAAVLGLGSALLASPDDGDSPATAGHKRPSTSADTISDATLGKQVATLLAGSGGSTPGSRPPRSYGVEGGTTNHTDTLRAPIVSVPSCVREGLGRDDAALAAKDGVYHGKPVVLVVLPDTSDTTRVIAYVVDATCVRHPSSPAGVLLQHSYARH
jgi:anti-sigma factor RsiW